MVLHLFCGANYYPKGGAEDYVASVSNNYGEESTLVDSLMKISNEWHDDHPSECCSGGWSHIVDWDHDIIKWYTYPTVDQETRKQVGGGWTDHDPWD